MEEMKIANICSPTLLLLVMVCELGYRSTGVAESPSNDKTEPQTLFPYSTSFIGGRHCEKPDDIGFV